MGQSVWTASLDTTIRTAVTGPWRDCLRPRLNNRYRRDTGQARDVDREHAGCRDEDPHWASGSRGRIKLEPALVSPPRWGLGLEKPDRRRPLVVLDLEDLRGQLRQLVDAVELVSWALRHLVDGHAAHPAGRDGLASTANAQGPIHRSTYGHRNYDARLLSFCLDDPDGEFSCSWQAWGHGWDHWTDRMGRHRAQRA